MNHGLFEWDEFKSASNCEKHGVSFDDRIALWADPRLIELQSRDDNLTETRFLFIGKIWAEDLGSDRNHKSTQDSYYLNTQNQAKRGDIV